MHNIKAQKTYEIKNMPEYERTASIHFLIKIGWLRKRQKFVFPSCFFSVCSQVVTLSQLCVGNTRRCYDETSHDNMMTFSLLKIAILMPLFWIVLLFVFICLFGFFLLFVFCFFFLGKGWRNDKTKSWYRTLVCSYWVSTLCYRNKD